MPMQVVIAQSNVKSARALEKMLQEQGDTVWNAAQVDEIPDLIKQTDPALAIIDLHLEGETFSEMLSEIQSISPRTKLLFTSDYPDPEREPLARKYGVDNVLYQPFTRHAVKKAVRDLTRSVTVPRPDLGAPQNLPRVRVPMLVKITIPYLILALVLTMAATFIVSRLVTESIEDRFINELIATGKQATDWLVTEEDRLLGTLRLVANSEGLSEAMVVGDVDALQGLTFNIVLNAQEEALILLDPQGLGVLSTVYQVDGDGGVYEFSTEDEIYADLLFVQNVIDRVEDERGDKFAGLGGAAEEDFFFVAGPILNLEGELTGVVLVGKSLDTLARQMREDTLAQISYYDLAGDTLASTLAPLEEEQHLLPGQAAVVSDQDTEESLIRELETPSVVYREILGIWQAREDLELGIIGAALPQTFLVRTSQITRFQILFLAAGGVVLVIGIGIYLSSRITQPLMRLVKASTEVAGGNLDVRVDPGGDDEVAVLAHSFNAMVSGLREGSVYRDLLGRTVSPEVREQLRQSFATGELYLAGQETQATVLISDIRGFTPLTESQEPTTVMDWLNEYFGELVPIINAHGGVINAFEGDALLAFFGILPRPMAPQDSAYRAVRAAAGMLNIIKRLNHRRIQRGDPVV